MTFESPLRLRLSGSRGQRYAAVVTARRSLGGALAGGLAAVAWAAQQPLDKRAFGSPFDDVELLGKLFTRGRSWPLAGTLLHVQNGMLFGLAYAEVRPLLRGPSLARGLTAGMAEHLLSWPLVRLVDRLHPARRELPALWGNHRAFLQATWRHLLFGALLGELERRLNPRSGPPGQVPASSNGHGDLERASPERVEPRTAAR